MFPVALTRPPVRILPPVMLPVILSVPFTTVPVELTVNTANVPAELIVTLALDATDTLLVPDEIELAL